MSSIKLNEANLLQSTQQFSAKQTILIKKTTIPMRKNQLESCKRMDAILRIRTTQLDQVQQFGTDTTKDMEENCAEFVQLDKSLLDNIEITG
ncbi:MULTISPECIES: hypothetical protein [unclassified Listeria]|uniref:hypothetical protein n=1 Tax=unclassified Listeria TaxID=2642072 RepID=UPI000B5930BD|nr:MULTISPECIES: hypothetical protein [unclassified Listeria]